MKLLPMKCIVIAFILFFLCSGIFAQSGMWTWMKGDSNVNGIGYYGTLGVPLPDNEPPGRYAAGFWTDTAGNFWVYGGGNSNRRNDLWKFNPNLDRQFMAV